MSLPQVDSGLDRRTQILDAAVVCFAKRGFHQASMHDISAEAGISVGLIYRYFQNKEAVISAMADRHKQEIHEILERARQAPGLLESLEVLFTAHCGEAEPQVVSAFVVVLFGIKVMQIGKMMSSPMQMPATTVTSAPVKEEDWAPRLSAVGSVSAVQGAVLSTDLAGTVAEVKFESGAVAKRGDILVRLEASSEEGQLRTAEADLELARQDLARTRDLATRRVISKAELDAAESKFKQKEGAVGNMRAMVGKKEVRAPFDGQLGIRQVNIGQMINAGQQVVALTALDPLYVDFALPQQELSKLSNGLEVRVKSDAMPGREFKGELTAVNSMVDTVTRNVTLQATLENPDHALRPGTFAKVEVMLPEKHKALVVPGSAISYAPFGDSV